MFLSGALQLQRPISEGSNFRRASMARTDGVNDQSLDYRAGWCEGLKALALRINLLGKRAKPSTIKGLEAAHDAVQLLYQDMLAKMRAKPTTEKEKEGQVAP
jgi:hypothetical protein